MGKLLLWEKHSADTEMHARGKHLNTSVMAAYSLLQYHETTNQEGEKTTTTNIAVQE
jgi:hypothetical protein